MVQKNSWTIINIKAAAAKSLQSCPTPCNSIQSKINLKDGHAYVRIYFLSFIQSISKPIIQDRTQNSFTLWNNTIICGKRNNTLRKQSILGLGNRV